ncbi:MAG TPA: ComEC/Rec2 family competence protein [Aeromicrobium sp.]|nr:ComEC/Rec2 family competence protein [Aeromicrobium sp.]
MRGTITGDPRVFRKFGHASAVVRVDAHRTTSARATVTGHDPVVAFLPDDGGDLWVGRPVTLRGRLAPADDTEVAATLDVDQRSEGGTAAWWWSAAQRIRVGVRDAVEDAPPNSRALVPALVDGDDRDVPDRLDEDFRRSGLTHLLAVSGTNLTIVLALVIAAASAAGVARRWRVGVGLVAVAGFVLVARPDPSVVRAAAMGVVGLSALQFGGRGGLRALSVAVVALLFLDPWLSRAPGFVLSVAATAGILCGVSPLVARFARWMPRWCAMVLAVPLAAQLACTPLIAILAQQVSVVAVFANVLAAPLVAPATIAGLAGGLLDLASEPLAHVAGAAAALFAEGIIAVARHGAALAGAAVPWRGPGWLLAMLVVAVGVLIHRYADRPPVIIGVVLGVSLALVSPPQRGWPPPGWVMVACDVGQGDATVVNTGGHSALLVDAGPDPLAIDLCLKRLKVRRLLAVVLTHAHADHVDGLPGATRARAVGPVISGPSGDRGRLVATADTMTAGPVTADVLWPPPGAAEPDPDDGTAMNSSSVVLMVRARGLRLLLAGDVETEAQERIVASGVPLAADVLKFAHHGSGRQSPRFLQAVHARIATVSVGADNDYGHPAAGAFRMLRAVPTDWRRTDLAGDIAIAVQDGRLLVVTRD